MKPHFVRSIKTATLDASQITIKGGGMSRSRQSPKVPMTALRIIASEGGA